MAFKYDYDKAHEVMVMAGTSHPSVLREAIAEAIKTERERCADLALNCAVLGNRWRKDISDAIRKPPKPLTMAQIHTFEFMQAKVNDLKAEIERLTKWNHDRFEELKERDIEIERLRAALEYVRGALDEGYHIPIECQNAVREALKSVNEQITK